MERFNGSYSSNQNYVHEIENGADLDIMHADDEQHDLHNYLLYQHLNPPIVSEAHSQALTNSIDPNDSYYLNGYHQQEEPEVVYLDEDEDQKPDIKKELNTDETDEHLQDICIDRDFKESDDGRVNLSPEYIKCLHEAKKANRCLLCSKSFKKLDQTIEHLQVEHFTEVYNYRYNCLNCKVAYRSSKRFNVHKTHIHNDNELFKCVDCNNKILSKFKVYKHLFKNRQCRKTSIKFVNSRISEKTDVENVCLDCRRVFKNVAALSNHIKSCDGKAPEIPQDIQEIERRRSNRMVSSTSVSSSASTTTKPDERRVCQYCSETVISGIERHEEVCRKKICPKCSKVFTTTRNCSRHIINIHRVSKNRVNSLWSNSTVPNQTQSFNGSVGDYDKNDDDEEEEDEDVVLSVDCCTHEEIPLKRNRVR